MRYIIVFICTVLLCSCATITVTEQDIIKRNITSDRNKFVDSLDTESRKGVSVTEKTVSVDRGIELVGVKVKPKIDSDCNILYYGGNRSTVTNFLPSLARFSQVLNCTIFMFDRRGYGLSGGEPGIEFLLRDALKVASKIRASTQSGKLIIHGQSLGSFEAAHAADGVSVEGLVLESSATDAKTWLDTVVPWYIEIATSIVISKKLEALNNTGVLQRVRIPVLILVGENDKTTPPELSKKIYDLIKTEKKTLEIVPNTSHENVFSSDLSLEAYKKFLNSKV